MDENEKYPRHKIYLENGKTIGVLIDYEDHTIQFYDRLNYICDLLQGLQIDMWKYDKTQLREEEIEPFDESKKIIDKYNGILNEGNLVGTDFVGNKYDKMENQNEKLLNLEELSNMLNKIVKLKNKLIKSGFTFNSNGYAERSKLDEIIKYYNSIMTKENSDNLNKDYELIKTIFNCFNNLFDNVSRYIQLHK